MIPYCAGMGNSGNTQRAKGRGSIVKRGGVYYGRWVVGGKVYTKTLKTSNRRVAEERLAEELKPYVMRDEAASLANVTVRLGGVKAEIAKWEDEKPALAFADAFELFRRRSSRASAETMDMYAGQFGRLCEWVRDNEPDKKELRHIDGETAERFMAYIRDSFSANTHNKYLALMRLMWRKLAAEIRAKDDPWARIERMVQSRENGRRSLSVAELSAVCAILEGEMRLLFALGIYTGLRLGDCALLKWDSIDMARGLIHVLPHKTVKTRRVVTMSLHPALAALLRDTPRRVGSPFVLPDTAALYRHDNSALVIKIQNMFTKAGIETNAEVKGYSRKVTEVGFHSLRHTFVSLCGNGGMPLAYIQSIVGHANPMMTSHYFHGDAEAHRQQLAAALPDVIEQGGKQPADSAILDLRRAHPSPLSAESQPCLRGFDAILDAAALLTADERRRLVAAISELDGGKPDAPSRA